MVRLLILAVVAALGVTAAMDASEDQSPLAADRPRVEAAPELVTRLMASPQQDQMRNYLAHPNVHPKDLARFPMPVAKPDPTIDYKMITVTPDPRTHYNMPVIPPGHPVAGPDTEPPHSLQDFGWFMRQSPGQPPRVYRILPDGTFEDPNQR